MDILYILKVLWRKKWWLILIPVISAAGALIFSFTLGNQYKASTQIATGFTTNETIHVSDERSSPRDTELGFSNMIASMNSGICNNLISYRLILHDLDSPNIAFRLGSVNEKLSFSDQELMLAKVHFRKKLNALELLSIDDVHAQLLLKTLDAYNYGYKFVKGGLRVYRVPNTDFIQVEFTSEDPNLSAYAVNSFCEEFLRYYRGQREEGSNISVTFFKQLVEQKKREMDEKAETLKTFKATNSFVNLNEEGSSSRLLQISDLETQRDNIQSNIYGLNLSIDRFKTELANVEHGVASNTGSSNARVLQLRSRINDLNNRYINSGSNNQSLLDSLNSLRNQLKLEISNLSSGSVQPSGLSKTELSSKIADLQIEVAIEQSKLNSVTAKLRNLQGSISGYVSKEAIVASLTSEVDVATKEYLEAVNRYNEANNKLLASTATIRQLFRATAPASHLSNKKLLIIGAAGFASFFFCVFVFVLLEFLDTTLKTPEHFKRTLKLDLAEQLIRINTQTLNFKTLFETKTNNEDLEVFKEFVRKLRFQIESTKARIFLVTSCKRGEGKTFVTFTLAYVLSLVNKKVLIIDTNFKNNALTKWLSIKSGEIKLLERRRDYELKLLTKGNDRATQKQTNEDSGYDLVAPTRFTNIYIIGNNGGSESPDEILSGRDFGQLIDLLSSEYDYIFLEGAALNDYSDSKELIKYVEKVIPVFAADTSIAQLDRESITFLRSLGKKLTGAILNKVDFKNLKL